MVNKIPNTNSGVLVTTYQADNYGATGLEAKFVEGHEIEGLLGLIADLQREVRRLSERVEKLESEASE